MSAGSDKRIRAWLFSPKVNGLLQIASAVQGAGPDPDPEKGTAKEKAQCVSFPLSEKSSLAW